MHFVAELSSKTLLPKQAAPKEIEGTVTKLMGI